MFLGQTKGVWDCIFQHKVVIKWVESATFAIGIKFHHMAMTVTGIYEALNGKAESFFKWAQAHPKFGLLFAAFLLALWLTGLLLRWKWACEWLYHGKLWFFDDCKPETKRRIYIIILSIALIVSLTMFFVWK